jgi:hypothetical protein
MREVSDVLGKVGEEVYKQAKTEQSGPAGPGPQQPPPSGGETPPPTDEKTVEGDYEVKN